MKSRACALAFVLIAYSVTVPVAPVRAAQEGKAKDAAARRREAIDHYNQGVTLAGKGDTQKAEDEYRKAIKADPTYAIAYNNLAVLLNDRGDTAGAEAAYKSAIEHDPHLFLAFLNLGRLQYNTKQLQAAEATLSQAVALLAPPATSPLEQAASKIPANGGSAEKKPDTQSMAEGYQLLGLTRAGLGMHAEAIKDYRRAIELNPRDARIHHNLAISLLETGDEAGAIAEYREAVRIDPKLAESYFNLGVILYRTHKNQEAIEAFKTFLQLQPDSPQGAQVKEAIKEME